MIGFSLKETEDLAMLLASYQARLKSEAKKIDKRELRRRWSKVHGQPGLFTVFSDGDEVVIGDDGEPEIVEIVREGE